MNREPERALDAIRPSVLGEWVRQQSFGRLDVHIEPWHIWPYVGLEDSPEGKRVLTGLLDRAGRPVARLPSRPPSHASEGLLPRFLALVNRPASVGAFVRRSGPLGLEANGFPTGAVRPSGPVRAELVADYQRYARLAAATLRLAAGLRAKVRGYVPMWPEDIEVINAHGKWTWETADRIMYAAGEATGHHVLRLRPSRFLPGERPSAEELVDHVVNWWLESSGARPQLRNTREGWEQVSWSGGLWGAIGLALRAAIAQPKQGFECTNCRTAIRRERRHAGKDLYCGKPACERARQRAYKQRQRTAAGIGERGHGA